jgi:activating signal cointegrator complex subunit 3
MSDAVVEFEAKKLGQIGSLYYLRHQSVHHLSQRLLGSKGLSMFALAKFLADCSEFTEFPMRHKDDEYNADLAERLPFKVEAPMDSPHTKALLLVVAHMFAVPMPIQDFFTDLRSFLDQSVRIIQAMLEVLLTRKETEGTLRSVLNLLLLNQCLAMGTHPWADLSKFMLGRKVSGLLPVVLEQVHAGERVAGLDGKSVQLLKKMPLARIKVGSMSYDRTVKVTISHENVADQFCQTPLSMTEAQNTGGKRRRVAWWLVVGSQETGEVLSAKRLTVTKERPKSVEVRIPDNSVRYKVLLVSDCYIGIDQEQTIE